MDEEHLFHLAFSHFSAIGPARFQLLYRTFGTAKKAYGAGEQKIASLIGGGVAARFAAFRKGFRIEQAQRYLEQNGIRYFSIHDSGYPEPLRSLSDAPVGLFVKGNWDAFDFQTDAFIGIVGTRCPSGYGQGVARQFASGLARSGVRIVSGMAMGIDAVAHRSALEEGGLTIAVLGCGVDIIYPASNFRIYEDIVAGGGAVVSEFPPGTRARREYFVWRNRLVSGLSRGVLVVEGTARSGTLLTARYAALQGKDVYAPPVPLTSELHEAPCILLKQGARLVTGVADILGEWGGVVLKPEAKALLTPLEEKIAAALAREAMGPDDLALEVGMTAREVACLMSAMEIKGAACKGKDGRWQAGSGS